MEMRLFLTQPWFLSHASMEKSRMRSVLSTLRRRPACGEDVPDLKFDKAETWQITRERIEGRRIWRSYLFGPWIDPHFTLNFGISDRFKWSDITCKSTSPSEVKSKHREWMDTFQMNRMAICAIWLSIILMACKHSIECIMWRDYRQDLTLRGQIEIRWVYDWSRSSGPDHSATGLTCPVDAQGIDSEQRTSNSEC